MLNPELKKELESQQYILVGNHSAVKTCSWTRKMIKSEGSCYKHKFYGIRSNQCLQMTSSLTCANNCIICWRSSKTPVSKEWTFDIDNPELIFENSIKAQYKLLTGLKGYEKTNQDYYEESKDIKHVALSLIGESILYPKINELNEIFNENNISTFLVTNAQYPEHIKKLKPVTQLYLSLDAPNKELLKQIDKPIFEDYWERLNKSLKYLKAKKQRTCIRLTIIKGINDKYFEDYSKLILKGNPDFIEIKAYMFLGSSRQRLKEENMPYHEDIVAFSKELIKHLKDYEIVSEHIPSRVIMLAKKKFKKKGKWFTWIDFDKFFKLLNLKKSFSTDDYLKETPETGLSGKGTNSYVRKSKGLAPFTNPLKK